MEAQKKSLVVQISGRDNVAIAVREIPAGTEVREGLTANHDIPQAHKIALRDIGARDPVIRYGVVLRYAKAPIK